MKSTLTSKRKYPYHYKLKELGNRDKDFGAEREFVKEYQEELNREYHHHIDLYEERLTKLGSDRTIHLY